MRANVECLPAVHGIQRTTHDLHPKKAKLKQRTRFVGTSYTFERPDGKPVALRAQVINVGNNNYWITAGGYLSQNQPRTVMVSLSADF